MRKFMLLVGVAGLAGCGGSDDQATNQVAKAPAKKKAGYCFFKEPDTKAWSAKRGKGGDIIVKGKAYRQDGRYMAVLGPATVTGATAELSPTVTTNNTGYSMEDGWWDVSATIPNSAAVTTVTVSCGPRTLATIALPPLKS
jgi:hypothetical protein